MKHFATAGFWLHYRKLPREIQSLADKNFKLLKADPRHPSLRLKRIGPLWTARVGLSYRAVARDRAEGLVWVWVGHHSIYDRIIQVA